MTNRPSNQWRCGVSAFMLCAAFAVPASAGPVTWEFEGEMTYFYDAANLFDGSVEVGTPYSGVFTFDSETPDTSSSSSSSTFQGAVTDIMIELGGRTVLGPTADFNRISIINDFFTSGFDNFGLSVSVMLGVEELGFGMQLRNSDGTMFDATTLPAMPPDIDLLGPSGASIVFSSSNELLHINGSITSIVPEPGTLMLVTVCAGLTCMQRRRRLRKARCPGTLVSSLLAMIMLFLGKDEAIAQDCNTNGINDTVELATCPAIDLAILLDTSGSQQGDINALCDQVNEARDILTFPPPAGFGLTVNVEILPIDLGGLDCDCCDDPLESVETRYGTTAPGMTEVLGDCEDTGFFPNEPQGGLEDWHRPRQWWRRTRAGDRGHGLSSPSRTSGRDVATP